MKKIVISILGTDQPGIVAAVSAVLFENECNIEDVNQTILQTEFAGIIIGSIPVDLDQNELLAELQKSLAQMDLKVFLKPLGPGKQSTKIPCEQFVVTTVGADKLGLVAGITQVMASHRVNITNLKAAFRGGDNPENNIMIYEVDIPEDIDQKAFSSDLRKKAESLGLDLSLQHRDIFEIIHRV